MPEVQNVVGQPQPDPSAHIGAVRNSVCSRHIPKWPRAALDGARH